MKSIYVFRKRGTDDYKIGYSAYPNHRLREIQTDKKAKMICVFTRQNKEARRLELIIHKSMNKYRINGEWYFLTEDNVSRLQTKIDILILNCKGNRPALVTQPWDL